jgi:hypothetical protein
MKRLFLAFFLLVNATPLFADEAADGTVIPDYQELVREGYGPRHDYNDRDGYYLHLGYGYAAAPKPTQAYYGKGFTVYYGYTPVYLPWGDANTSYAAYAFGHPLEYYRRLIPGSVEGVDLNSYIAEVRTSVYAPGEAVADSRSHRGNAVTTVQKVSANTTAAATTGATKAAASKTAASNQSKTLPVIGEMTGQ